MKWNEYSIFFLHDCVSYLMVTMNHPTWTVEPLCKNKRSFVFKFSMLLQLYFCSSQDMLIFVTQLYLFSKCELCCLSWPVYFDSDQFKLICSAMNYTHMKYFVFVSLLNILEILRTCYFTNSKKTYTTSGI